MVMRRGEEAAENPSLFYSDGRDVRRNISQNIPQYMIKTGSFFFQHADLSVFNCLIWQHEFRKPMQQHIVFPWCYFQQKKCTKLICLSDLLKSDQIFLNCSGGHKHPFTSTTQTLVPRAPSQYPKRRLFVRSREFLKPRDRYFKLSDRSEIWQALRQHCCRCACQISKRYDNLKYRSRGFETSRDLTKRRLIRYWDGAQVPRQVALRLRGCLQMM